MIPDIIVAGFRISTSPVFDFYFPRIICSKGNMIFGNSLLIPLIILTVVVVILTFKGFAVVKLEWSNLVIMRGLTAQRKSSYLAEEQAALTAIIERCRLLQRKWITQESDFNLLQNTHDLVAEIAQAYHPKSAFPLEEARICRVLQAALELKTNLIGIAEWKGIRKLTQFRLRHLLTLSRVWKLKEEVKEWRFVRFMSKHKLFLLLKWVMFVVRFADLTYWCMRMFAYILEDIILKVFLVRWYLIIGRVAMQVYRDKTEDPKIEAEELIKDFESIPDPDDVKKTILPREIRILSENSKEKILFHVGNLQWDRIKTVYMDLIVDIARIHHPLAENPLYEMTIFNMLMGGARFFDRIAAVQTYPYFKNVLNLKIAHVLMINTTIDYLQNNVVLDWFKKYKLGFILRYAFVLYKMVKAGNPIALLSDFAFSLVSEGCKRWFYLYLHDEITIEANFVYGEVRKAG